MFDSQGGYKLNLENEPKQEEKKIQCSACGAEMTAGAVICLECGTNQRTGQKMPGAGNNKKKGGGGIATLIKVVLVLLLLAGAAWGAKMYFMK